MGHRASSRLGAASAALVAALLIACPPPAGAVGTPADDAATHAYIAAEYARARAVVADLPASIAAVEDLASRLGSECPGVLAGASTSTPLRLFGPHVGARRRGELKREENQTLELQNELELAVTSALEQPDRQADATFAGAVTPLRWSNPAIAQTAHLEVTDREERLAIAPNVCADMRAWADSGYRILSPATRELLARRRAIEEHVAGGRPTLVLLAPYESPADKALLGKTEQLARREVGSLKVLGPTITSLQQTLGLTRPHSEAAIESLSKPARDSVVVAHGRTAAGGSYSVRVEPHRSHLGRAGGRCVSVTITNRRGGFGTIEGCYPRSRFPRGGNVNCDQGLLTVEAQTDPRARTVSLRLSDGRRIESPVVIVPARLGGPVGLYYQVVRGPSPIPVSLTELDANGVVLRVVKLPRIVQCTKNPIRYLPHGVRTLVREDVPQGPSFTILGKAYRFLGRLRFHLELDVASEATSGIAGGSTILITGGKPSPLSPQFETVCRPHPYEIVYGLLAAPGDSVIARSANGAATPLRQVAIPAALHAHGELVYAALPVPPTELVVQSPSGATVATEDLQGIATEGFETCEGEEEPAT